MNRLDIKKITDKIIAETPHWPTMLEKAFEKGLQRGFLDGLYKADVILQASDIGEYHLLDDIIKEYQDRNL